MCVFFRYHALKLILTQFNLTSYYLCPLSQTEHLSKFHAFVVCLGLFSFFLLVWCPSNPKYHRTDAKCAQLPTTLAPDLQNQPEMGSKSYPQIVSPVIGMTRTYLGIENFLVLFMLTIISSDLCVKSRSFPVSILRKSTPGRHRPVSYPDGPRTARYRST